MAARKRLLLWDYTNTRDCPDAISQIDFNGPIHAVSNWNAWIPPELQQRLPFQPTVRTPAQLGGDEWTWLANDAFPFDTVHFYNEPDRQPGVTPQAAADAWRAQMVGVLRDRKGKKLVGPSCASDPNGSKWLAEFMALTEDCKPDYLGVHWYGTDANEAKNYIEGLHRQYGLPVVVSEIGSIHRDGDEVNRFTVEVANWMDAQPWIYEYGFFGCMRQVADDFVSPAAQLMEANGKFTPLMEKLNHQVPMQ